MKDETQLTTAGRDHRRRRRAVNPPVTHASTVLFASLADLRDGVAHCHDGLFYGRFGTEAAAALRDAMTGLEHGAGTVLYPCGLAAITHALLAFAKAGDHVLVTDSIYEPTREFCATDLKALGIESGFYPPGADIEPLMRPNTTVVLAESPGSLTFEVQDIAALSQAAHRHKAVVIVDNTWATPLLFKPLDHGADISVQAATKYIVGHSDAMLGTASANQRCWHRLRRFALASGQCAAPDDIYLALRGLRTLGVRLARHQQTGLTLARWLAARPEVARVLHPGLPGDPGHALWSRDFAGACGLFGVVLKGGDERAVAAMVDDLKLFGIGFSWGGFESLILPIRSPRTDRMFADTGPLLRLHAGLEDPDDLIADLEAGLKRFSGVVGG